LPEVLREFAEYAVYGTAWQKYIFAKRRRG